ncbi:MAG: glycerophosphodiester phosphodiesterase [Acidimicrobiales bacterium]
MIRFAHRGGAWDGAAENTLVAFGLALDAGARAVESDVWVTADGVAVLDHDGDVDGRSLGELAVADLPGHIPTLAALLDRTGPSVVVSLDVKDPDAFGAVVATARAADALDRVWLCFHRWRQLVAWRAAEPQARLVDSTYVGFMRGGPELRAERLAEARIDAVNLHHSEWTGELVATFAARGLQLWAWDVQTATDLDRMSALGIDAVFTDQPHLL